MRVLLDPPREPLPPFEQRLVHELDGLVAGDEEPPLDERCEYARDAFVLVGVELCARRAPSRERLAVAARDESQQDPTSDRSLVGVERLKGRLGVPADCAADAVRPFVRRLGERRPVPLAPEVEERRLEKRQAARLARDVVDQCVDERRLDLQPDPLGGPLDRAAKLRRAHRPEQSVVRADEVGELPIGRETAEEVRAQREQDERAPFRVPGRLHQCVDERPAFALGYGRGEQLFELVDRDHEPLARSDAPELGEELRPRTLAGAKHDGAVAERREQARAQQRRLAAPRRPDERKDGRVCESSDELGDKPLASAEELRVRGLERGEPLVRADVSKRRDRPCAAVLLGSQGRVLEEDRPLELLQLDIRLEPELVAEERARFPVDGESLGLPARPVEREHELRAEPLAVRMLRGERLELRHERELTAERQLRVDSLLDRSEAQLLESLDLDACERLELEVGQRPPFPERERGVQGLGGGDRFTGRERVPPGRDEAFEAFEVELAGLDTEQIAGRTRDEPRLAGGSRRQDLSQARDLIAERVVGGGQALLREELLDQPLARDDPVRAQE